MRTKRKFENFKTVKEYGVKVRVLCVIYIKCTEVLDIFVKV